jgi:uncharacterized membrane protein YgcG
MESPEFVAAATACHSTLPWDALAQFSHIQCHIEWPDGFDDAIQYPAMKATVTDVVAQLHGFTSAADLQCFAERGHGNELADAMVQLKWQLQFGAAARSGGGRSAGAAVHMPQLLVVVPSCVDEKGVAPQALLCPPSPGEIAWATAVMAALPQLLKAVHADVSRLRRVEADARVHVPVDDGGNAVLVLVRLVAVKAGSARSGGGGSGGGGSSAGGVGSSPARRPSTGDEDVPASVVSLVRCRVCSTIIGEGGTDTRLECKCGGVVYCGGACQREDWALQHARECAAFVECFATTPTLYNVAPFPFLVRTTTDVHEAVSAAGVAACVARESQYLCTLLGEWGVHLRGPWCRVCPCGQRAAPGQLWVTASSSSSSSSSAVASAAPRHPGGRGGAKAARGSHGKAGRGGGASRAAAPSSTVTASHVDVVVNVDRIAADGVSLLSTAAPSGHLRNSVLHGWPALYRSLHLSLDAPDCLVFSNAATLYYIIRLLSSVNQVSVLPAGSVDRSGGGGGSGEVDDDIASTKPSSEVLLVDYLGPTAELDFPTEFCLLQRVLPGVSIHIRMIGEDVPASMHGVSVQWLGAGQRPVAHTAKSLPASRRIPPGALVVSFHRANYAHLLATTLDGDVDDAMPDVVVALHAGMSKDPQWQELLSFISVFVEEGLPFFASEADLWSANQSMALLTAARCAKPFPVTLNPFRCPLASCATGASQGLLLPGVPNAFLIGCGVEERPPAEHSDDDDDGDDGDGDAAADGDDGAYDDAADANSDGGADDVGDAGGTPDEDFDARHGRR